jgi:hypothetical protein
MAMTRKDFRRWTEEPTLKDEEELVTPLGTVVVNASILASSQRISDVSYNPASCPLFHFITVTMFDV